MSDKVDDGGPAFPLVTPNDWSERAHGMTLHQYYAGQALAGICANPAFFGSWLQQDAHLAAGMAHGLADAMLAARKGARDE
jgi:hypothetical protein